MGHRTDQHLEHAEHTQHHAQDPYDRKVAMSMAVLAAVLAGVTMLSHRGHTETLRLSTQANINHTQATDQWNLYQAKNIRSYEFQAFVMSDMLRSANDPGRTHLIAQVIAAQGHVSPGAVSPVVPQTAVALGVARLDALALANDPSEAKQSKVLSAIRKYWIRQIDNYEGKGYWAKMIAFLEGSESKPPERRSFKESELLRLMGKARELEQEAKKNEHESHHVHGAVDWIDGGHLALDLALVLCTVALLTRQRSFWYTGLLIGLIGALVAGVGVYQWVLTDPVAHAHH
jgi:hypothetical protein